MEIDLTEESYLEENELKVIEYGNSNVEDDYANSFLNASAFLLD